MPVDGKTQAEQEVPLRRIPVQERGRQQVQRILQAAAELIAEVGVDTITTNAVAARAKISVGSLYQFFPNKVVLVRALAIQLIEDLNRVLPVPAESDPAQWSLQAEVERIIQVLFAFIAEYPAYPHVYQAARGSSDPESAELLDAGKQHIGRLLARRAPWVDSAERRAHVTVIVESAHTLLMVVGPLEPAERNRLIDELILMLVRYLEPVYGDAAVQRASQADSTP